MPPRETRQYNITINLLKVEEWGLNLQQAVFFAFLYELPSWANHHTIDGNSYHWITYGKIISEMPILSRSQKKDTIYKNMKVLSALGLIEVRYRGTDILVRTTEKGKLWNRGATDQTCLGKKSEGSEKYPSNLGKKSELTSEKNLTNHNTTYPPTKSVNHHPLSPSAQEHEKTAEEVEEYLQRETDRAEAAGEIRTTRAKYAAGVRKKIMVEGGKLTLERRQQLEQWQKPIHPPGNRPIVDPDNTYLTRRYAEACNAEQKERKNVVKYI